MLKKPIEKRSYVKEASSAPASVPSETSSIAPEEHGPQQPEQRLTDNDFHRAASLPNDAESIPPAASRDVLWFASGAHSTAPAKSSLAMPHNANAAQREISPASFAKSSPVVAQTTQRPVAESIPPPAPRNVLSFASGMHSTAPAKSSPAAIPLTSSLQRDAADEAGRAHAKALKDQEAVHAKALKDQEAVHAKALEDQEAVHAKALEDQEAVHAKALEDQEAVHAKARKDAEAATSAQLQDRDRWIADELSSLRDAKAQTEKTSLDLLDIALKAMDLKPFELDDPQLQTIRDIERQQQTAKQRTANNRKKSQQDLFF